MSPGGKPILKWEAPVYSESRICLVPVVDNLENGLIWDGEKHVHEGSFQDEYSVMLKILFLFGFGFGLDPVC